MKKYPYKSKRKQCYTSPTSGRVRCGNPMIHFDEDKKKEFVMVRAVGGGTKRLYSWRALVNWRELGGKNTLLNSGW